MFEGYIILYRCLLDKPIWKVSTDRQKVILVTLLLMANHRESEWEWGCKKFKVMPGEMVTSLKSISEISGCSTQSVRTSLLRFKKLEFLTYTSTKTGRLITILNWGLYQCQLPRANKEANKQLTNNQQTANKQLTTNKECNNDNNENNEKKREKDIDDFFSSIWQLYPKKEGKASVSLTQKTKLFKIGYEEMSRAVQRYASEKADTERKFLKQGSTFFNSGYVDYLDANYSEEDTGGGGKFINGALLI